MYKRSWNKKFGKSEIYKSEDSFCQKVEIDMLRLADGDVKSYREEYKEYALVILGGKCTVKGDDFAFENAGYMHDGVIYTAKITEAEEEPIMLGDILQRNVDEKHYIPGDKMAKWTYLKGAKKILRK